MDRSVHFTYGGGAAGKRASGQRTPDHGGRAVRGQRGSGSTADEPWHDVTEYGDR